jgi:hypothetical protein
MKSTQLSKWIVAGAVAAVILAAALPGEAQRRASAQVGPNCSGGVGALFDAIEPAPLSDADTADVLFLREEEKLARDVYLTLAERWQLPIFANIARAEQRHMDLVLLMLETYGLEDPVVDDGVGAFTDPSLDSLFDELTAAGEISLIEALFVGATIEDMDLADLLEITANTENRHLALVAYNLAKGSRNHLRAFVKALAAQGETYTPQYLDQAAFDAVLAAEMERRVWYDAEGEPVPACGAAVGGFGMRRGPGQGGQGSGGGAGECGGTGDCGAGPNGGHQGNGNGSGSGSGSGNGSGSGDGNGDGDCDGTGPHGSGGS